MSLPTLALALALPASRGAYGQTYWFETYERAVRMIDRGEAAEASPLLDSLIREHPYPISGLRVPGDRSIDYLPHFQRARIHLYRGDARAAAHSLDIEEAFGAVVGNKRASKQLLKLRQQIETMEAVRHPNGPTTVAPASAPH
jgi:hypothetical protein